LSYFCQSWVWIQSLGFARQVNHHLSHTHSHLNFGFIKVSSDFNKTIKLN
jgi:hypothetical protein